jgi:Uncharacterized conserved protein
MMHRSARKPLLLLILLLAIFHTFPKKTANYGVFLGVSLPESGTKETSGSKEEEEEHKARLKQLAFLSGYKTVIVSPGTFTKEDLDYLKKRKTTVYAYINVGALEQYNPDYKKFQKFALAPYENWEDEEWVDVSQTAWQDYITEDQAKNLAKTGFDGFFLDNFDVYDRFPTEDCYRGLTKILQNLQKYKKAILLNGGDRFVQRVIEEEKSGETNSKEKEPKSGGAIYLFQGVNQEDVFTSYNFSENKAEKQEKDATNYYKDYLKKVQSAGLSVYITEYEADETLSKEIEAYCKENHFTWYNAPGIALSR